MCPSGVFTHACTQESNADMAVWERASYGVCLPYDFCHLYVCGLNQANLFRTQFFTQNACLCSLLTPLNSSILQLARHARVRGKNVSGSYLATHSQTRQEKWRENKVERDTDTLKEMGEIEKGRGRHSKKHSLESLGSLSRQPTVNKPPWEIQDSHAHARIYTTIKTTKHNKKDPQ